MRRVRTKVWHKINDTLHFLAKEKKLLSAAFNSALGISIFGGIPNLEIPVSVLNTKFMIQFYSNDEITMVVTYQVQGYFLM